MKRRDFIVLISGVATLPLAARAQTPVVPRIGYIWTGARGTDNAGFRQGLADMGYVVGHDLVLEERYADGNPERVPALVAELLALKVDVLLTPGTPITLAAQRATSRVPIVCVVGDPVRTGLVTSLARPGGNVTGLSLLSGDYSVKWLELLKEVAPMARQLAMLWNPDNPGTANQSNQMQQAAPALSLDLITISMRPEDVQNSL